MKKISWIKKTLIGLAIFFIFLTVLSVRKIPNHVNYGVSFSVFHSNELGLDWKKVYLAILDDLKVKKFRFSAHWPLTEPSKDQFNWNELDFQMDEAKKHDATVILAVGRRLPGWPECHEPDWAKNLSKEEKRLELLKYIEATVKRYKDHKEVSHWQVENEPFLSIFSKENCGDFLDKEFLRKEIALVKKIDPTRPILTTDSGELSLWKDAYELGDSFGTTLYIYIWNHYFGSVRYPITPGFFRIKRNIIELIYGKKDVLLIELSLEPWLLQPIKDTPMEIAIDRMNLKKVEKIINFARKAGFEEQYLWGAEWWYFMKEKNHPEYWERARKLFVN